MPKDKLSIEVDVEKLGVCTRHDLFRGNEINEARLAETIKKLRRLSGQKGA